MTFLLMIEMKEAFFLLSVLNALIKMASEKKIKIDEYNNYWYHNFLNLQI